MCAASSGRTRKLRVRHLNTPAPRWSSCSDSWWQLPFSFPSLPAFFWRHSISACSGSCPASSPLPLSGCRAVFSARIDWALRGVVCECAMYRARRYRLPRTVYRGLRFHQEGSAWAFAFRALAWWAVPALPSGLAYPFQLTSLERYKMRHTYYGDLAGRFEASALPLMLRGFPMWLLVIAPLAFAVVVFASTVDWAALAEVLAQGGDDMMSKIEGNNPNLG